jgi:transposase
MKTLSRHSELAKAFTYTLNQWPALTYYAENGWAEDIITSLKMRCGWSVWVVKTGCSSAQTTVVSGERCYSLIGTCKLNGVDPESYLRHVLDVIADWPVNRVSELLLAHHTAN